MTEDATAHDEVAGEASPDVVGDLEARRRRAPVRILVVGLGLSLALALASGAVGAPGAVGGVVFLSVAALTVAVAGGVVAVGVVVDQFRGVHVPTRRILLTGGLMLLTLLLLVASAGAMTAVTGGLP